MDGFLIDAQRWSLSTSECSKVHVHEGQHQALPVFSCATLKLGARLALMSAKGIYGTTEYRRAPCSYSKHG